MGTTSTDPVVTSYAKAPARTVPVVLSEDLHHRIRGSELVIYPDSGHGGIFQFHENFAPAAVEFLDR